MTLFQVSVVLYAAGALVWGLYVLSVAPHRLHALRDYAERAIEHAPEKPACLKRRARPIVYAMLAVGMAWGFLIWPLQVYRHAREMV